MITAFNANNVAQQWFFKKAFNSLANRDVNLLTPEEIAAGRFLSLDGYFSHMRDLILINPVYAMLPTDEEPFMIDTNSRTISIPGSFNKCAGVTGDDMCEIATFVVDRFYDYVDLATANICIQWTTKNGNEGISHITLIDTETIPGKIRFGWPLTAPITSEAGAVTFAVRFFLLDEDQKVKYVLNTLKTAIVIREGLQLTGKDTTVESNNNLFTAFIKNSDKPSYPIPKPVTWGVPGEDLPATKKIVEAETVNTVTGIIEPVNSFILRAQGVVEDNGLLQYTWYFKSDDEGSEVETLNLLGADDDRFIIEDECYVEIPRRAGEVIKRKGSEQYYIETANGGHDIVIGDLPQDKPLFERYTTLQVNPESESQTITGEYWVGAINYVGPQYTQLENVDKDGNFITIQASNHSPETTSSICKVLGPAEISLAPDLANNQFLKENKAELKIDTVTDGGNPLLTYKWYYSPTEITEIAKDANGIPTATPLSNGTEVINAKTITAEKAGWYYSYINSKLNRKEKKNYTNICRVIKDPEKPQIVNMKYLEVTADLRAKTEEQRNAYFAGLANTAWNYVVKDKETKSEMTNVASEQGQVFRLQVDTHLNSTVYDERTYATEVDFTADTDVKYIKSDGVYEIATEFIDENTTYYVEIPSKLLTDELLYKWYVITPDASVSEITAADADPSNNGLVLAGCSVDKNYLDVRCTSNSLDGSSKYSYYCVITNKLAGEGEANSNKPAVLTKNDYSVLFHIS